METSDNLPNLLQKVLLYFGIIAPLIYLGTDLLAGKLLKGYSFSAQSISELSAAGSPTRTLVIALSLVASVFLIAFGIGIWWTANQVLLTRIVGGLVIVNAITGVIAMLFFPTRFGERPLFGSVGVILMFISVVCFVLAMVFGIFAFNGWLRIFSIMIPMSYIILAALRFKIAAMATEAVSLIGSQERTMSYSFLFWIIALAIYLLQLLSKTQTQ